MIIVLKPDTNEKDVKELVNKVESFGLVAHVSKGEETTVIGMVGDVTKVDPKQLEVSPVVDHVMRVSEPYKLANRAFHPEDSIIDVAGVKVGGDHLALIAGPCSVESKEQVISIAREAKAAGANMLRGGAFKPRTSPYAFQGMGTAIMNRLEKAAGHLRIQASEVVKLQKYRRITFVSGTDSARGPMCAELLRHCDLKQEYVIDSRGMVVLFPEPANQKAEAVMKSVQMTLEGHSSLQLDPEEIQEDTLILTIDQSEKEKILAECGPAENVYTLNEFTGDNTEIPDPYGKPLTAYGECMEVLEKIIKKLADKLNSLMEEEKWEELS